MTDTSPDRGDALARALRDWAAGTYHLEVCVEILARGAGGHWLARSDFLDAAVQRDAEEPDHPWLDLEAAATFAGGSFIASGGERRLLRLAISFANPDYEISLNTILASLDATATTVVLEAVAHAMGWHEQPFYQTVIGGTFDAERPTSDTEAAIAAALAEQDENQ